MKLSFDYQSSGQQNDRSEHLLRDGRERQIHRQGLGGKYDAFDQVDILGQRGSRSLDAVAECDPWRQSAEKVDSESQVAVFGAETRPEYPRENYCEDDDHDGWRNNRPGGT